MLLDKRLQNTIETYLPTKEALDELSSFFTIFCDNTRLKIISALSITQMCVSDISTILKLNQTTVSHQLRLLKNLNAVTYFRQGKIIFYKAKSDILNEVMLKAIEFLGY